MFKLIIISLLLLIGCTKKNNDNNLVMCTNATYPPYESIDNQGNPVGFDIDVADAISKILKRNLVVKQLSFDSLILGLDQNKCDFVMAGMSITPSRQKEITMIPYQGQPSKSYYLIFWEKVPDNIKSAADIKNFGNKTIAVQVGTWMEDYINTIPGITVKPLDSTPELLLEIKHRKSVASFVETHIGKEILLKESRLRSIEVPMPEKDWQLGNGIGIKKSNLKLADEIKTAVETLQKTGVMKSLEKKWFTNK